MCNEGYVKCTVCNRMVSFRVVSDIIVPVPYRTRNVSYRIVSYRIVSYRIVSYPYRIVPVSYRIVLYRIVSYRIVSYRLSRLVPYRIA